MERMAQPVVRLDSAVAGTLVPRPLYKAGAFLRQRAPFPRLRLIARKLPRSVDSLTVDCSANQEHAEKFIESPWSASLKDGGRHLKGASSKAARFVATNSCSQPSSASPTAPSGPR